MADILHKRGTGFALFSAASSDGLKEAQIYYITDAAALSVPYLAVATGIGSYVSVLDESRFASFAEAEAGVEDDVVMSPLRTSNAINNNVVSQAVAEAGAQTTGIMSPQRVDQYTDARLATQAEAETGTNNTQLMTPLRTKQAIDENAPVTEVLTVNATTFSNIMIPALFFTMTAGWWRVEAYIQFQRVSGAGSYRYQFRTVSGTLTSGSYTSSFLSASTPYPTQNWSDVRTVSGVTGSNRALYVRGFVQVASGSLQLALDHSPVNSGDSYSMLAGSHITATKLS